MFVIEGPDSMGKTTVAEKLLEMSAGSPFPLYYQHSTRPHAAFDFLGDYRERISTYAVMDRFHMGGFVYQKDVTLERLRIIEGWLYARASFIVVMAPINIKHYRTLAQTDDKSQMYDAAFTERTAAAYHAVASNVHPLAPYYDVAFMSTPETPYPTENMIQRWWVHWRKRLEVLNELEGGQPCS